MNWIVGYKCSIELTWCTGIQDLIVNGGPWLKNILRAPDAHVYVSGGASIASGIADAIARLAGRLNFLTSCPPCPVK